MPSVPTYVPIATITLPSNTAELVFDGIPQTYQDLVISLTGRSASTSVGDALFIRLNGDTGTRYSGNRLFAGDTLGGNSQTSATTMDFVRLATSASSNTIPSYTEVHLFNYATSSTHKVAYGYSLTTRTADPDANINHGTAIWRNTSEGVNRITFYSASTFNLAAGFQATLYGIGTA